jgi:putative ATPase
MDLFFQPEEEGAASGRPLADRMRPRDLDEFVGQQHILAPGKPLRVQIERDDIGSILFWGPPGSGKTTLAKIIARRTQAEFVEYSAVMAGIKEIKQVMVDAERLRQHGRRTIVFIDEIHRFNKAQQDAFLPHVESGLFTFIGATTENPSFEVVGALLSRAQVYVLKSLTPDELGQLMERALKELPQLTLMEGVGPMLAAYADGDARKLLNLLEQLDTAARTAQVTEIDTAFVENALAQSLRRFDKGGEAFYDQISALHKSVRGSDPDASLYWLVRMLDGGADPRYLGRRLIRMASEDIGLADPRALGIALDAVATYERLGSPEGELALAEACLYMACAPKSNAAYVAYNAARAFVQANPSNDVPLHLRNAPTKLMKELGYGRAYRYAHDEPEAYAAGERYFPDDIQEQSFYQPTPRGLEGKIAEKLAHLRMLDEEAGGG